MTDAEIETYPYRPPIRETTPNNLPFVIKCGEKFPSEEGGLSYISYVREDGENSHIKTTRGMPELQIVPY